MILSYDFVKREPLLCYLGSVLDLDGGIIFSFLNFFSCIPLKELPSALENWLDQNLVYPCNNSKTFCLNHMDTIHRHE